MVRPILLGVCSALFFAVTFVLNRRMELAGGNWAWRASLRYLFTLPFSEHTKNQAFASLALPAAPALAADGKE